MNGHEYPVSLIHDGSSYEIIYSGGNSMRVAGPFGKLKSISNNGTKAIIVTESGNQTHKWLYDLNAKNYQNL